MDDSKNLSITQSQSGHDILIINGVEMHSRFNPVQEAYEHALKLEEKIKMRSHVLVLGVGLGYHIQQLEFKMREFHKNPKIYVVEPNSNVTKLAVKTHILPQKNITIFSGRNFEKYYQDQNFIEFLSDKPLIIPHVPTLNLESSFFKKFLSYKASRKLKDICAITLPEIKAILQDKPLQMTLDQFISDVGEQEYLTHDHFKFLAFGELCRSLEL